MKMSVPLLKLLSLIALACAAYGVVFDRSAFKWGGWIGFFPPAEALGFLHHGGTFSAFEWALRASANPALQLLGACICALFLWCGGYHFVVFRDWTGRRFKFVVDGAILISGAFMSLVSARASKKDAA
jgi:hypothetical protein